VGEFGPADKSRQSIQSCTHKPIAGRVNRKFLEPAEHLPFCQKQTRFSSEEVDSSADSCEDTFTMAITASQVPPESELNRIGQKRCNQVGQIVNRFVCENIADLPDPDEV
jgi:hypothetical protein